MATPPNNIISTIQQTVEGAPKTKAAAPVAAPVAAPKQSQTEMEVELQQIMLESKRLELETKKFEFETQQLTLRSKKAELQDIEERLAERELKRENNAQKAITNGQTLIQIAKNETAHQKKCNHRKGGNGAAGVVGGRGDSPDYAVIKHTFAHGDTWIRCQRCGKTWKPPIKKDFKGHEDLYDTAMRVYEMALEFQTKNVTSAGVPFRFSDDGEFYREQTRHVSLR
jgi:hypothetical protein